MQVLQSVLQGLDLEQGVLMACGDFNTSLARSISPSAGRTALSLWRRAFVAMAKHFCRYGDARLSLWRKCRVAMATTASRYGDISPSLWRQHPAPPWLAHRAGADSGRGAFRRHVPPRNTRKPAPRGTEAVGKWRTLRPTAAFPQPDSFAFLGGGLRSFRHSTSRIQDVDIGMPKRSVFLFFVSPTIASFFNRFYSGHCLLIAHH